MSKIPLSLRIANEVIEFPTKDTASFMDLVKTIEHIQDRYLGLLHFAEEALEPGEQQKLRAQIESTFENYFVGLIQAEDLVGEISHNRFNRPPADAEVLPLDEE